MNNCAFYLIVCTYFVALSVTYGRKIHTGNTFYDHRFPRPSIDSKYKLRKAYDIYSRSQNNYYPSQAYSTKLNVDSAKKTPNFYPNENIVYPNLQDSKQKTLSMEVGKHLVKVTSGLESKHVDLKQPNKGGYGVSVNPKFGHVIEIIPMKEHYHEKEYEPNNIADYKLNQEHVSAEDKKKAVYPIESEVTENMIEIKEDSKSKSIYNKETKDTEIEKIRIENYPPSEEIEEQFGTEFDAPNEETEEEETESFSPGEEMEEEDETESSPSDETEEEEETEYDSTSEESEEEDETEYDSTSEESEEDDETEFESTSEESEKGYETEYDFSSEESVDDVTEYVSSSEESEEGVTGYDSSSEERDEDETEYEASSEETVDNTKYQSSKAKQKMELERAENNLSREKIEDIESEVDSSSTEIKEDNETEYDNSSEANKPIETINDSFSKEIHEHTEAEKDSFNKETEDKGTKNNFEENDTKEDFFNEEVSESANELNSSDSKNSNVEHLSAAESHESAFTETFEGSGDELEDPNSSKSGRLLSIFSRQNTTGPNCTTPKGESGQCRRIRQCLLSDTLTNFNLFLQHLCLIRGALVGICCPNNPVIEITNPDENATNSTSELNVRQPPEGCGLNTKTRIVGGTISVPHEWTWMVALLRRSRFYCGGVIINNWYILTAAHCVLGTNVKDLSVRLGEYDFNTDNKHQEDVGVAEIKRHAQFVTLTFQHDIALLKLKRSIQYSKFVGSICLPNQKARDYSDVKGTVVGWGTVSFGGSASPILRQVTVPVWKNEDCDRAYLLENINEAFMCAGSPEKGEDACQGDSGGPLMALNDRGRWEVIGLVSWGRRCGDPSYPGVYTRVTTYLDWIHENAI